MAAWDNGVSPPGGASYSAPLLNFSSFGNWAKDYLQGQEGQQQQQLNAARIADEQRKADIAATFKGGLPIDPRTGQPDYAKAASMLAAAGDPNAVWNASDAIAMQSAGNVSPLLAGGGQPAAQPQGGQPASVPAPPMRPNRGQQGDQPGSLTALVTDRMPAQNQTTGATIMKIAEVMGIDPNATLTPGQQRRAQGLLAKYAPEVAGASASAGGEGGSLPPSANAVSPAPKTAAAPAPAAPASFDQRFAAAGPPQGGASRPPAAPPAQAAPQPQAVPQQPAAPAQPQGGPITPQVPLPVDPQTGKRFTDPQTAILALKTEAARLSANPHNKGQVDALNDWATRIETSRAPVKLGQYDTYVNPTNPSQVLAQGPGAAALAGSAARSETMESDAEVYRQTGKLPTNIGRGVQGAAESRAIREAAREKEIADGGDPAEWPSRWQKFTTQAAGRRTLETRAAGLTLAENEASSLIPRVRQASANVSRTEYPSINALINAAKKGSGGTDVIKLGIAVESLVPVYARVLKPVGQLAQGDMARAHDILDKAWSDGQINAALDQMQVELGSARTALDKTMDEFGSGGKAKTDTGQSGSAKPDAKWTTLPNGVRIREVTP